jgi:hypothetical protein
MALPVHAAAGAYAGLSAALQAASEAWAAGLSAGLQAVVAAWAAEPAWTPGGRLLALVVVVTSLCVHFGSFNVLRAPLLVLVSLLILVDLLMYAAVRAAVTLVEWVWVVGYKRRDRKMRPSTYAEWIEVGSSLDRLENLGKWKAEPESMAYNWRQIRTVTARLREARQRATAPNHSTAPKAQAVDLVESTPEALFRKTRLLLTPKTHGKLHYVIICILLCVMLLYI